MTETNPAAGRDNLPPSSPPINHGNTTAAWVTVLLVVLGALVASVAIAFAAVPVAWVGVGIVLAGLVAGRVLKMLGFGQPGSGADRTSGASH